MADIDVVHKKGGMTWVIWVVLALVALAVVWMLVGRDDQSRGMSRGPSVSPPVSSACSSVV